MTGAATTTGAATMTGVACTAAEAAEASGTCTGAGIRAASAPPTTLETSARATGRSIVATITAISSIARPARRAVIIAKLLGRTRTQQATGGKSRQVQTVCSRSMHR